MGMKPIPKGYAPAIRSKIGLEKEQIKYLARNTPLTYMQVVSRINEMLKYILKELKFYVDMWIKRFVPKRTGQLQHLLIKSMDQSSVKWGMLKLILGTRINYADQVNQMTASMVRHFGQLGYGNYGIFAYKGKRPLNDPEAAGHFFDALLSFIQERAHTIISQAINQFFSGSGTLNKYVKSKVY